MRHLEAEYLLQGLSALRGGQGLALRPSTPHSPASQVAPGGLSEPGSDSDADTEGTKRFPPESLAGAVPEWSVLCRLPHRASLGTSPTHSVLWPPSLQKEAEVNTCFMEVLRGLKELTQITEHLAHPKCSIKLLLLIILIG